MPDAKKYRTSVEKWVEISAVVKVSEEDIAWLYPATSEEDVAREWIELGAKIVVITRGADGLVAISKSDVVAVPRKRLLDLDHKQLNMTHRFQLRSGLHLPKR